MKAVIIDNVKTIIYALIIAGIFRSLFFQPFFIPSGSMKENLLVGDFLFVNKMAYGYSKYSCPWAICPIPGRLFGSEPERGDVVVFRHPTRGEDYIKRLIALPGETIRIRNGVIQIKKENGWESFEVVPNGEFTERFSPQGGMGSIPRCTKKDGTNCVKTRYLETPPDSDAYTTLAIQDITSTNFPEFTVPEGEYFFMGDNRDNSLDSRVSQVRGGVGTVPFENLIGRADRVVFSSAGSSLFFFWTWRGDRFFKAI
ncbi:MAG: signal peptidase I [Rhodobacteraceae bacterium]|nr:signal peptidase I [Paracoccaceae bacterium]